MNFMSVVQAGLSLQSARLQSEANVAALRTSLDIQEQQGAQILALLESSQMPVLPSSPPGATGVLINTVA